MIAPARILVVEDEPRLGELLRLYLERDGYASRSCAMAVPRSRPSTPARSTSSCWT